MSNKSKSSLNWSLYCVIIPVYNNRKTLPVLIERTLDLYPKLDIIIVDDGSEKDINGILSDYDNLKLVRHSINQGKGAALKSGIRIAKKEGKKFGIFLDSDLQHDPVEIQKFLDKRLHTRSDIILGNRKLDDSMPFHRVLSNRITSFLISIRSGTRVHDSQCGFRLLNLQIIKPDDFKYNGFQFESEFLLKTLQQNSQISEVDISTIYNDQGSNIENMKDTFRFIKMYFESYFWN